MSQVNITDAALTSKKKLRPCAANHKADPLSNEGGASSTLKYLFTLPILFRKHYNSLSVEEEATRIQQERLTTEEDNRMLREAVFESQGRARAAEAKLKKVQVEVADSGKQLRIMTDQNAELLRLLEEEESQTSQLGAAKEVRTSSWVYKSQPSFREKFDSLAKGIEHRRCNNTYQWIKRAQSR